MAFDAVLLSAALDEVRAQCLGGRLEKLFQPTRDTLVLLFRGREKRCKLLIAASPASARMHLTALSPENPPEPPLFCMVLRKHLLGARLTEIVQLPMERTAELRFDATDEMGFPVQRRLVVELMGRTCNVYLLDEQGKILDCLRRFGLDESARAALPGLLYRAPAPVEKLDPRAATEADFQKMLNSPGADLLADRLMDTLGGVSALVCREAALDALGDIDARMDMVNTDTAAHLATFFGRYCTFSEPWLASLDGKNPKQYAVCPIRQYPYTKKADSFGALLDGFYAERDRASALSQRTQTVRKTVNTAAQRLRRKITVQQKELAGTADRERLRQLGDILMANLSRVRRGETNIVCEDFYDEQLRPVTIPLSPKLTPQQNAAKLYKDYNRKKNAERELTRQLELGGQELNYLESVLDELSRVGSEAELEEIRQELCAGGYLTAESKKRAKTAKTAPMRFESTEGIPIYVGRNNRQNDELTFRMARKDDIWCHASKVHGSHVIIACGGRPVSDDTVTQAAQLAAHYAETAGGQNVPVDVTPVKQVKRVPNAKPGMVIYHTYRTVVVNPYPDIRIDPLNAEAAQQEKK